MTSAPNHRLLLPGLEIEYRDSGGLVGVRAVHNRDEHRSAAWQHGWQRMIELALPGIGYGEHLRRASRGTDAEQAGRSHVGCKHDRVVGAPAGAAQRPLDLA